MAQSILQRASPKEVVAATADVVLESAWPHGEIYALDVLWERGWGCARS